MAAYNEALKAVQEKHPQIEVYAERCLQLVEKNPKDPAAVDALLWVIKNANTTNRTAAVALRSAAEAAAKPGVSPAKSLRERALEILLRDYVTSDKLVTLAERLGSDKEGEKTLRLLIEKNPHRDVQGTACVSLALRLKGDAQNARRLKLGGKVRYRLEESLGKERVQELLALDLAKVDREVEQLFDLASKKYSDVQLESRETTVGKLAEGELFEIHNLAIGKTVPDIAADDLDGKAFKLSDYRGKVVMLDFWGHW
jgi:hypothetical protein